MRQPLAALSLTAATLIGVIVVWEGYSERAYVDPAGVPTLGFGATEIDGRPVRPDDRTSPVRALVAMGAHLDATQAALRRCIGEVPLYPHEWDAYVSWAYNVGTGAACRSTLVRRLRQDPPDYAGACDELLRWRFAAGRELEGLKRRREAEHRLCRGEAP